MSPAAQAAATPPSVVTQFWPKAGGGRSEKPSPFGSARSPEPGTQEHAEKAHKMFGDIVLPIVELPPEWDEVRYDNLPGQDDEKRESPQQAPEPVSN